VFMERRYKQLRLEERDRITGKPEPSGNSEGVRALTEHAIKRDMSQFHASIQGLSLTQGARACCEEKARGRRKAEAQER